jgi:hypothetical protein
MGRETKDSSPKGLTSGTTTSAGSWESAPYWPEYLASRLSIMESIVQRAQQTADALEDDRP